MQRLILILFIASELCFYLLIAQTGIVEYFSSNLFLIAPLPIGGIIGSLLVSYIKIENKNKISIFLMIQLAMSFIYPNFNFITLFILGLSVGSLAPLIINEIKKTKFMELGLALSISYVMGTFLFNYDVASRGFIAILLTTIALIGSQFLPKINEEKEENKSLNSNHSLVLMVLWVFLDSALFESLSRDISISIWRDGFTFEIALFHVVGVFCALYFKIEKNQKELFIITLFALSYLFYFLREGFVLALIYPFVISYYNVVILQTIVKKDFRTITLYMICIGWIASGLGLFVALGNLILFVPIILLIALIRIMTREYLPNNKEIKYV
jgi:beta-carotene 15,15'-dioxygenase